MDDNKNTYRKDTAKTAKQVVIGLISWAITMFVLFIYGGMPL